VYISDFLTPSSATDAVWPASLQAELQPSSGPYLFDVTFRAEDRDRIARELTAMTERRFEVARRLYRREPWDLFTVHEIGPDRLHHAFWKYFDPTHRLYDENAEFRNVADEYYALLDREIAAFLDLTGDDVSVLIASDHGSQAMDGCFCINEWLMQEGFLTLKNRGATPGTRLEQADVDWKRTRVWGAGGYYARLFFNVRGRDPEGVVAPSELPDLTRQIRERLQLVTLPTGDSLGAQVHAPADLYHEVRGDAPDLMAYFGGLRWRSAGTVGHGRLFLEENDTGPDDAVHSFDGFYMVNRGVPGSGAQESILDVAPTLLTWLGEEVPTTMQGRTIQAWVEGGGKKNSRDRAAEGGRK
ncbi:MAG: alkaline phosphatase family protein, partial [Thermoplasmata archaeon]